MNARPGRSTKPRPSEVPTDGSACVSSLRACRDDPERVSVRVSGVLLGRVGRRAARELGVEAGTPWTRELHDALGPELERSRALAGATRLMAARDRSSAELEQALRARGHERDAIDGALRVLRERAVLDDGAYAKRRARSIAASKPAGRRYIESKLRAKGLGRPEIEAALDEALEGVDLHDGALRLGERAAATMPRSLDHAAKVRRLSGRLARRGFEPDLVRRVVLEILGPAPR